MTHTSTCSHGQALFSWQPRWQLLSDWVASPPLFIITDLASPPPLQPLLFLTFSDIYPPPQWQRPARSHRPAWVSLCGLVCWMSWSTSMSGREREGKQQRVRESTQAEHRVQSTSAAAVLYTSVYFYHYTHNPCTSAACALIWVCLRPPSMTRSWEKRTRSEGGQERQRKSRKAVNK